MANTLFLFGAGASFGSDRQGTPPLTAHLFDALLDCGFESWCSIEAAQAGLFRRDFELGMAEVKKSNDRILPVLQRDLSRFLFPFCPLPTSVYVRLCMALSKGSAHKFAFASLNYDRLFPLAISACGWRGTLHTEDEAPVFEEVSGTVEVCLPHGACNIFVPQTRVFLNPELAGASGTKAFFNASEPEVINSWRDYHERIQRNGIPPMMCHFEEAKGARSGRNFLEIQQRRMLKLVNSADKVVIIGVRLRERDFHIWNPLVAAPGGIIHCSPEQPVEDFTAQRRSSDMGGNDTVLQTTFADGLPAILGMLQA